MINVISIASTTDYVSLSAVITFTPMDREQCIIVNLIDDEVIESQEIFFLSISSDNPDVTFTNEAVSILINDSSSMLMCILWMIVHMYKTKYICATRLDLNLYQINNIILPGCFMYLIDNNYSCY